MCGIIELHDRSSQKLRLSAARLGWPVALETDSHLRPAGVLQLQRAWREPGPQLERALPQMWRQGPPQINYRFSNSFGDPFLQCVVVTRSVLAAREIPAAPATSTAAAHNGSGIARGPYGSPPTLELPLHPLQAGAMRLCLSSHGWPKFKCRQPTIPRRSKRFTHAHRKDTIKQGMLPRRSISV